MSARVIAHRGATNRRDGSHIRENTLEAFSHAIEIGVEGIELDVRRTSDDLLVIHHDAHVEDGRMIREIHSDELPEWMPTLAEALEVCHDTWMNIEIKNLPDDPDYDANFGISLAVAALIRAHDAEDRVLVSSFNFDSVHRIREHDPEVKVGWIVWGQANPIQIIGRCQGSVDALFPHEMLIDRTLMAMCRDADLEVYAWNVNDPEKVLEMHRLRVNGIITDQVGMTLDVLYGESRG